MASGLVDLSLFAHSPTLDHQFSNIDRIDRHQLYNSATWPARNTRTPSPQPATNKPLPKLPRKNIYDFCMPTTGSKCVLRRIKRVKLDTIRGEHRRQLQSLPSAYASAPSAYINPNLIVSCTLSTPAAAIATTTSPTIQARRNRVEPQLTLPDHDTSATPSNNNNNSTSSGRLPMIWLPSEQMWLVADPTDPSYGYYATGGPDESNEGVDWLPPYTENDPPSPASEPSNSDFSPVREQFLSLIEPPTRLLRATETSDDQPPELSPLFQEAMAGVGLGEENDGAVGDYDCEASARTLLVQTQHQQQERRWRANANIDDYNYYNNNNNSWTTSTRTGRHDSIHHKQQKPLQPRSESPALRSTHQAQTQAQTQQPKYMTDQELVRMQERQDRQQRQQHQQHQQRNKEIADQSTNYTQFATQSQPQSHSHFRPQPQPQANTCFIPYSSSSQYSSQHATYKPSNLSRSRRESWHSDSCTSTSTSTISAGAGAGAVTPSGSGSSSACFSTGVDTGFWPVRSSSARH